MTQRSADIVSGILLAVIGAAVVMAAFQIKSVFGERLPPRTLPLVLGSITVFTGILLSVQAYYYKGEQLLVDWPEPDGRARLGMTVVCLVGYLLLIEPLGIAVASFLFSGALIYYLDRRLIHSLGIAVIVGIFVQIVFVKLLQLSFPVGFWAD
ncbi:MAG: tripartite tricarboxylate transporter TctB family protein [Desulfomonile sp.]|jgi:hypothetical protein